MYGELANYGEINALNAVFRTEDLYMGLATAPINDDDDIGDIEEVTDSNYSRIAISFDLPFQEGGMGTIKNEMTGNFGPWSADQPETITHIFITTVGEGTAGELVAYAELPSPKEPEVDELIILGEEDFTIRID